MVSVHSSAGHCSVSPTPFAEETVIFPLDILSCFVKDQLAICLWADFWVLCSILLIYVSVFVPIPYYLEDYSYVVEDKSGIVIPPALVFFFNITLATQGLL